MKGCLLALALLLGACASSGKEQSGLVTSDEQGNLFTETISGTFYGVIDTIKTPFRDLGFITDEIPEKLASAANDPYEQPSDKKCKAIKEEIASLNELLGQDKYDAKVLLANADEGPSYLAEGAQMVSGMAVAKATRLASLPFRGVIRRISGAAAHDEATKNAIQAGEIRRAYLRGMADSPTMNCYKQPKKGKTAKPKPAKKADVTNS